MLSSNKSTAVERHEITYFILIFSKHHEKKNMLSDELDRNTQFWQEWLEKNSFPPLFMVKK
jgi:hypothetical protein